MEQDLFQLVPSEITINILSRLPVRAIATSKCVCKPWLDLLSTDEFVNSHLSKSVPALAVLMLVLNSAVAEERSIQCNVFEFEDEVDDIERRYIPLTKGDFSGGGAHDLVGAADGLLLLLTNLRRTLYICNPITREYVELCGAIGDVTSSMYGFGASRITGQHKFIQIFPKPEQRKCDVNVYTLETGSWRRSEATAELHYNDSNGALVNGNLHWLSATIACFDLETECFSTFSAPFEKGAYNESVSTLKDHLCMCVVMPSGDYDYVIDIWLMKEYGVEKSWTKEYVIRIGPYFAIDECDRFYPINVFKNGDILISGGFDGCVPFRYSIKTRTAHKIGVLERQCGVYLSSWLLTLSFLSLKRNLGMENVISF